MRPGQWVVYKERVGIHVNTGDNSEVHLTNAAGETTDIVFTAPESLREATINEIPEPRRPNTLRAAVLGIPATVETAKARMPKLISPSAIKEKVSRYSLWKKLLG